MVKIILPKTQIPLDINPRIVDNSTVVDRLPIDTTQPEEITQMTDIFKALLTTSHTATALTSLTSNIGVTLVRFDEAPRAAYPAIHENCKWFAVNELGKVLAVGPTKQKVLDLLEEDFGLAFLEVD
jgi:hypothetical protein